MIQIYLVDLNIQVCEAFQKFFGRHENIKVFNCPFQELPEFDCMVSPANSYGSMSGGVDLHIRNFFGKQLEERVQQYIQEHFYGEQPVGTSFIIETNHPIHPFLAHTPTMRVPTHIEGRDNVYNAMRGLLIAVMNFNNANNDAIQSIACTGMGTLIGGMTPESAVGQMELAYRSIIQPIRFDGWMDAWEREEELKQFM